jgi:phosphoserine aminotransferase
LVYKNLIHSGGLEAAGKRRESKAAILYDAIDQSEGFYEGHATVESRSRMNVTFTLRDEQLTKSFVAGAEENDLDGLMGHRSVGGCRASIYDAFPEEGCVRLAEYMAKFASKNG